MIFTGACRSERLACRACLVAIEMSKASFFLAMEVTGVSQFAYRQGISQKHLTSKTRAAACRQRVAAKAVGGGEGDFLVKKERRFRIQHHSSQDIWLLLSTTRFRKCFQQSPAPSYRVSSAWVEHRTGWKALPTSRIPT